MREIKWISPSAQPQSWQGRSRQPFPLLGLEQFYLSEGVRQGELMTASMWRESIR